MTFHTDTSFHDVSNVEIELMTAAENIGRWDWLSIVLCDEAGKQIAHLDIYSPTGSKLAIETKLSTNPTPTPSSEPV